ncbi:MAG: 50S ribosomal protein L25 [Deltaproteobacteria bacterium]|nr:50S ribosomal protein L25 [Deltaproteobacteria bacterium]
MEELSLSVEKREGLGKGAAGRLRREGVVPAVLYGAGLKEAVSLQMQVGALEQVLHAVSGRKVLLKLAVEGEKKTRQTILQSVQRHPVSRAPLHVDFYEVEKGHTVVVEIPITVVGKAEGVALGGILQQDLRTLEVECMPTDVPATVEVDVTSLGIGNSIHVSDLTPSKGQTYLNDPHMTVVSVTAPVAEEEVKSAEEVAEELKESFEEKGEEEKGEKE